jgi:hypothetical protein
MRADAAALFLSTVLVVAPGLTAQGYRFADIPWGSTGETVKRMMAAQGLEFVRVDLDGDYAFKGTLAQYPAVVWALMAGGKLVKVSVHLATPEQKAREEFGNMKQVLTTRYGAPSGGYEYFDSPYQAGDGYEDQAIRLGKGHFFTLWTSVSGTDTSNLVLQINEALAVVIGYESPQWDAEADRRQAKRLKPPSPPKPER